MDLATSDLLKGNATTAAPPVADGAVVALLGRHYGLRASISRLASERDEMFRVDAGPEGIFVLRLSNPADDPAIADMQTRALAHVLHADPTLPVPATVPSLGGEEQPMLDVDRQAPRLARLSTFLMGQPLTAAPRSRAQRHAIGAILARLDLALAGFSHPADRRIVAWDLQHAAGLIELVPGFADAGADASRWAGVRNGLERFKADVAPRLAGMRERVIHGDFNPHNILVDSQKPENVCGILDFGDMVRSPLINDLAIAACYHAGDDDMPEPVADVVGAYHRVLPLQPLEIELLHDLMSARLYATVAITHWRARRHPGNAPYILKNAGVAWRGIERLAACGRAALTTRLRAACPTGEHR